MDEKSDRNVCGVTAFFYIGDFDTETECELVADHPGDHWDGVVWFSWDGEGFTYADREHRDDHGRTLRPAAELIV